MARPLRIEREDGWFHVMARGLERRAIFRDEKDRRHWLELLAGVHERYRFVLHADTLMDNHYHLVLQTPDANLSQGMQWLQQSYSSWFNVRHHRVGPLFQGRFKSVPVENGAWARDLSFYVHLNPLRIAALGLDKKGRKAEGLGWKIPSKEVRAARLSELRAYRWSSYRAYGGYEGAPRWLESATLLLRGRKGRLDEARRRYRNEAQRLLTYGAETPLLERYREGFALGSEEFRGLVRQLAGGANREVVGKRVLRSRVTWGQVVEAVEEEKGAAWDTFAKRWGDWGVPMAMWLSRRHGGLRLREIGEAMGGMDYAAVSDRLKRFEQQLKSSRTLRARRHRIERTLNLET